LGIGDWGLGIGDWGLGPIPNPQSPIPNPQSPIPNPQSPFYPFFIISKNNKNNFLTNNIPFYFVNKINTFIQNKT